MRVHSPVLKKILGVFILGSVAALSGCWYDSGSTDASTTSGTTTIAAKNSAPSISGAPGTTIVAGDPYRFVPTVADADGDKLTFSVDNLPAWANFSTVTGELYGTPQAGDVGSYSGVVIRVSDGVNTSASPAFAIAVTAAGVGTATLSWVAPTLNDDGTPLQGLAGYVVFYGTNSAALDHSASINDPATLSYQIRNLPSGTWYFRVVSVTGAGVQSRLSTLVSKTIS